MADALIRIFISYSRVDTDFVDKLQADLQARNFDVWVDRRKLEGGRDWAEMIETAIDRCQVMVVVFSPDALESEWVRKEYSYAQDRGKRIVPLHFRPTPKVPMRLNELQYVDFERNYDAGVRELLIALTPITALPPPPTVPTPPLSAITTPAEATDDLVVVRPAPPRPNQNLEALYRAGLEANVDGDLERAAVLWGQILEQDPNFQNGTLKTQFDNLNQNLRPIRIQRLRDRATQAIAEKDWRQAAGAWQAILDALPQDPQAQQELRKAVRQRALKARRDGLWGEEIGAWEAYLKLEPGNEEAKELIPIAEQNLQWEFKYASAQEFTKDGKLGAAKAELELLWSNAPYYGDPTDIASTVGIDVPPSYEEVKAAQQREVEVQRQAKIDKERAVAEERQRAQKEREATERASKDAKDQEQRKIADLRTQAEAQHKTGDYATEVASWKAYLELQPKDNVARDNLSRAAASQQRADYRQKYGDQRYFIHYDLKSHPFWIFLNSILALTGIGATVGIFTQSWYYALAAVGLVGLIFYAISLRKIHTVLVMLLVLVLSGAGAFGLTWLAASLDYAIHITSHLWLFGDRTLWSGRQVDFGIIGGLVIGLVGGGFYASLIRDGRVPSYISGRIYRRSMEEDLRVLSFLAVPTWAVVWIILALVGTIFGWGFGFGYGWNLGLFLAMIPAIYAFGSSGGILAIATIKPSYEAYKTYSDTWV